MASNWLETIPCGKALKLAGCVSSLADHQKSKTIDLFDNTLTSLVERASRVQALLEKLHKQPYKGKVNEDAMRPMMIDLIYPLWWLREDIDHFSKESSACQFIRHRELGHSFQRAHEGINEFVQRVHEMMHNNAFELAHHTKKQWCEVLHKDFNSERMRKISTEICQKLEQEQEQDAKSKTRSTLAFELERSRRCDTTDEVMEALRRIQNQVAQPGQAIQAGQVDPESWFIPSDEIRCQNEAFNAGGCGKVLFEKWRGAGVCVKRILPANERYKGKRNGAFRAQLDQARQAQEDSEWEARVLALLAHEINIWHQLDHPHVLKFYGATHINKNCCVVSEYASGGRLNSYLAIEQNAPRARQLLYEASLGIAYLHQQHVVHADLKCDNILVGSDGKCKIMDFGLSFYNGNHADVVCTDAYQWMAPECFVRGAARSFATDVYMFGMCIVEALTGKVPWGDKVKACVQRFLQKPEIELPIAVNSLDKDLQRLVRQMCKKAPEDRITMCEVAGHLKRLADE